MRRSAMSEICLVEMEWLVVVEERPQVIAIVVCWEHTDGASYLGA